MRTLVPKKLLMTVVLTLSALVAGFLHAGFAEGQSSCPAGFAPGTDAWGVQGCINVGYRCPIHGSWSVSDNKCDCLPQWPVWDNNAKQCLASRDPNLARKSLFATSENRSMCINNPYQSRTDGTQLVVNQNCSFNDPASVWEANELGSSGAYDFQVDGGGGCMDNHLGDQSNGNPIVRWACNGSDPQMWDFDGYTFHWHPNLTSALTPNGILMVRQEILFFGTAMVKPIKNSTAKFMAGQSMASPEE